MSVLSDAQRKAQQANEQAAAAVNTANKAYNRQSTYTENTRQLWNERDHAYRNLANKGYTQSANTKQTLGRYNNMMDAANKLIQNGVQYQNKYDDKVAGLLDQVENKKMDYSITNDPAYMALRNTYVNEANKAMRNATGEAVAQTGGYGSTAAAAAAQQAYNESISGLNAEAASLYDAAANRFSNEKSLALNLAQTYANMDYKGWEQAYNEWDSKYKGYSDLAAKYQSMYEYMNDDDRKAYETKLDAMYKELASITDIYNNSENLLRGYANDYISAKQDQASTTINAANYYEGVRSSVADEDYRNRQLDYQNRQLDLQAQQIAAQQQAAAQKQENSGIKPKEVNDRTILQPISMNRGDEGRLNKIKEFYKSGKIDDAEAMWLLQYYNLL